MKKILVIFKHDLRLHDNTALYEAAKNGEVIPLFVLDDSKIGGASKWWLHYSLESLAKDLAEIGGKLIIQKGEFGSIVDQFQVDAVYWNRSYEPTEIVRDSNLKLHLKNKNIEVQTFNSYLLFEPWEIKNKSGNNFKIFTPFWKTCLDKTEPEFPTLLEEISFCKNKYASLQLSDLELLPTKPDWAEGLRRTWEVGEKEAHKKLDIFIENALIDYKEGRNYPAKDLTSKLSPYLHFGQISPRQIWHKCKNSELDSSNYLMELGWREFSYHLLYHNPHMVDQPLKENFKKFPWNNDHKKLRAWQKGQTGFPIIDAGMRELYETGYMHNRVRMIVGSFLTKDLLISWTEGAKWFFDCLVDADLASNSASWQWVAGSGTDASPYFRIFNPSLQSEKFDKDGEYIKRWVPELKNVPAKYIHVIDNNILRKYNIVDYPSPIIDHNVARDLALKLYKQIK